ncbi:hypothetical protein GCM10010145_42770 [Streptomyces ruber]|uniref:Uncharacterized protein n=2 Tax=Streptomyces TaxID=1883 RepID=A0A918ET53_9ACTN|nr:hypothetical protein [Streptomyces ruber]GGQ68551.1 hypothetical protein GCM10010145_42770 [Streptomyces ruber]
MTSRRAGFDVRILIAGLLGLYGVVLTLVGVTDSEADLAKADGLRVNLWIGIALLVVAAAFGLWARLRPLTAEHAAPGPDEGGDGTGR